MCLNCAQWLTVALLGLRYVHNMFVCRSRLVGIAAATTHPPSQGRGISSLPLTDPGAYVRDAGSLGAHMYSVKWHQKLGPIFRYNNVSYITSWLTLDFSATRLLARTAPVRIPTFHIVIYYNSDKF